MEKQVTVEELKRCDGQDGRPAYVAFRGRVYDVSESVMWASGRHRGRHQAGQDLTAELAAAPHDEEVLQRMPLVGTLVTTKEKDKSSLLTTYSDLHPHPVSIHFPIALTLTSAGFLMAYLATGIDGLVDSAFYALMAGVVVSPVAILTGAVSWWYNHGHKLTTVFKGKAGLSAALFPAQLTAVTLWALNRQALSEGETIGWVYLALVMIMAGLVLFLGKLGGTLVFPPRK